MSSNSEQIEMIGSIIRERYQLDIVLGHGSMGTTYKAQDLQSGRPVAVKILHFSRVNEWKVLEMFEREAKILQQLNHPRIPSYIEYFSYDSKEEAQFILVQEYIEGKTIEALVGANWRGSETEILELFSQLVSILEYLHGLNPPVIHRDINPKNIILSSDGKVFLVDFGAVQERIRTTFLGGSTIVGTFGYVPFEQFSGQTVPASDYYAAGATLLYLLSHRHPSDFPTDKLKPDFRSSLHCSTHLLRLLDGLFEPDVTKRVSSAKAVKKILKKGLGKKDLPEMRAEFLQPTNTSIQKTVGADGRLVFQIPTRHLAPGVKRLAGGVVLLTLAGGIPPLGFVGIGLLAFGLSSLFGKTVVELTPEWVNVRRRWFRFDYRHSKAIPTASIKKSDIISYFESSHRRRWKKRRSALALNHGGTTLELGAKLSTQEAEWLMQEIDEYILKYAKSIPKQGDVDP